MEAPKGRGPEGWGPKFRAFFPFSRHNFLSLPWGSFRGNFGANFDFGQFDFGQLAEVELSKVEMTEVKHPRGVELAASTANTLRVNSTFVAADSINLSRKRSMLAVDPDTNTSVTKTWRVPIGCRLRPGSAAIQVSSRVQHGCHVMCNWDANFGQVSDVSVLSILNEQSAAINSRCIMIFTQLWWKCAECRDPSIENRV